jgi:hypothetical protein
VILVPDEIDEVIRAQMPLLAEEHVDDFFPLAGVRS